MELDLNERWTESNGREIVLEIQQHLNWRGYAAGPEDGVAGKWTSAAIAAFQRNHDLPVNGVPSASILSVIKSSLPKLESFDSSRSSSSQRDLGVGTPKAGGVRGTNRGAQQMPSRSAKSSSRPSPPDSQNQEEVRKHPAPMAHASADRGPNLIGLPYKEAQQISGDCHRETRQLDVDGYNACLEAALRRRAHSADAPRGKLRVDPVFD